MARKIIGSVLKVITAIYIAVMVLLAAVNVVTMFKVAVYHDSMPSIFGYTKAVVQSGSMEPDIQINDIVFCKEQFEYKVGDVILFNDGDNYVLHRIIDSSDAGFTTKGDANNTQDEATVPMSAVAGKLLFVWAGAGTFFSALGTIKGYILASLVALAVLAVLMIGKKLCEPDSEDDEQELSEELGDKKEDEEK